jgi:hypothetical protein
MSDEPVTTSEVTIERVERGLAILALLERLDGPLACLRSTRRCCLNWWRFALARRAGD